MRGEKPKVMRRSPTAPPTKVHKDLKKQASKKLGRTPVRIDGDKTGVRLVPQNNNFYSENIRILADKCPVGLISTAL